MSPLQLHFLVTLQTEPEFPSMHCSRPSDSETPVGRAKNRSGGPGHGSQGSAGGARKQVTGLGEVHASRLQTIQEASLQAAECPLSPPQCCLLAAPESHASAPPHRLPRAPVCSVGMAASSSTCPSLLPRVTSTPTPPWPPSVLTSVSELIPSKAPIRSLKRHPLHSCDLQLPGGCLLLHTYRPSPPLRTEGWHD